jgi:hypothetical protein
MAADTMGFGKKFVGDLLGTVVRFFPEFPIELRVNYHMNLKSWKSHLSEFVT